MSLFSYVVARDYGFAPNPFYGLCTLATCKPAIRRVAAVGDWIVGISSRADRKKPGVVYVMRVDRAITFEEYWADEAYQFKKANLCGSVKQAFGDNIYRRSTVNGRWIQAPSHHSHKDGQPNQRNIDNDTQTNRVLIGARFVYWGSEAPDIPARFLNFDGMSLDVGRGYKSHFSKGFEDAFVAWFDSLALHGYVGAPYRWVRPRSLWSKRYVCN